MAKIFVKIKSLFIRLQITVIYVSDITPKKSVLSCLFLFSGETKVSLLSNGDDDDASDDRSTNSIDSMIAEECGHSHHRQSTRDVAPLKQSSLLYNAYDGLEKGERIDAQLEAKLRMESMANCHTLHRLDSRNDRQTRFLLSVDATALATNPVTAPQRLAEFSQTINRIFTSSPQGESGVIWYLDDPKEMKEPVSFSIIIQIHNIFLD